MTKIVEMLNSQSGVNEKYVWTICFQNQKTPQRVKKGLARETKK